MATETPYTGPCNIFARELERVLNKHGLTISKLDDLKIISEPTPKVTPKDTSENELPKISNHIERATVGRLNKSLKSPSTLPVLSPADLLFVKAAVPLTDDEYKQLLAAVLATAIERILMDRIELEGAYMITEEVLKMMITAMDSKDQSELFSITKGLSFAVADPEGDTLYEDGLDLIDQANVSLHLAQGAATEKIKIQHAHEAVSNYDRALQALDKCKATNHQSDDLQAWIQEATAGRKLAAIIEQGKKA